MKIRPGRIQDYIRRIDEGKPFTFARYGDGEFASILGHYGQNCDGVEYSDGLKNALRNTLYTSLDYDYGMLAIALRTMGPAIENFIARKNIQIEWVEGTFLVAANRHGRISPLIQSLQNRAILYVGPKHLSGVNRFLPVTEFITVHETKAFDDWEKTVETVLRRKSSGDFIGVSAGPTAKVVIHKLYQELGSSHTIFDFGSIWDGYVGVKSRKYMRRATWSDIKRVNLENARQ